MPATRNSRIFFGWWIVGGAFVLYFVSAGLFATATVYFKALTGEFGWSRGEVSGAFSLGFVVAGLAAPIWGMIADRRGPRSAFLPGVLLSGILCMLLSRVWSLASLYVLYLLFTAAAGGISLVPVGVLISNWFVEKRGRAVGAAYTGGGFGGLFLIPVVGFLVATVGWRAAYVVSGLVALVLLTPVALWIKNRPDDLGLFPDGIDHPSRDCGAGAGEAADRGFALGEAVKTTAFWLVALTWMVMLMPLTAVNLHQVPFLTDVGLSTERASLAAGAVGGMSIVGRLGFGILADRFPTRVAFCACYLMVGAGIASLWATTALGTVALVLYVVLFGIAVGGSWALPVLFVGELFGGRALGGIFGLLGVAATIGGAVGATGAGVLFDRAGNYDSAFALSVAICALGALLILLVKAPPPKRG